MMRVALVSPLAESVPPRLYGGTERIVYNLCKGLTEADVEVTVFASGDSSTEGRLIPVVDEAFRLRKNPLRDLNAYYFKMLAQVAKYAGEFDVIHNHHDYWMLPLTEMTQTPVLTTLHGQLDLPDIDQAFYAYPRATFVSISDQQRRPIPGLKWLRTIYNGIDTEDFLFHEKPGRYLAFLGRIDSDKRPEWAIEIAKRSGVPLKIAAKIEGPEGQAYYDRFVKPHVDGKFIEYLGEITDTEKNEFLGNALALVFPIDWPEPFGLVTVEALACGTPVLARPLGAIPEVLSDGVTGYLDLDIAALAQRVRDLSKISRTKCREWVEKKFSLTRMTEDYIHVYRHLAEFNGARARTGKGFDRHRWNFVHPF